MRFGPTVLSFFHEYQNGSVCMYVCCYNKHNCEETMSIHPPPCGIAAPKPQYIPPPGLLKVLWG